MKCDFFSLTDPGRVRANNEDSVTTRPRMGLVALADGMGGYNAGEIASALCIATLTLHFEEQADVGPEGSGFSRRAAPLLQEAIQRANRAVFEAAHTHAAQRGMATTLVAGVFHRSRLVIGHVGDSRAYRLRQGHLSCLTRDHSLLQQQLDAGLIAPNMARMAHYKNLVTRAIGVAAAVDADIHQHVVQSGDTYLFCSDGLNDMLSDAEMARVLLHHGPMERTGHELLRRANAAGGRDNISLVLVQCSPEPAHLASPATELAQ